jgi:hypothetical protein
VFFVFNSHNRTHPPRRTRSPQSRVASSDTRAASSDSRASAAGTLQCLRVLAAILAHPGHGAARLGQARVLRRELYHDFEALRVLLQRLVRLACTLIVGALWCVQLGFPEQLLLTCFRASLPRVPSLLNDVPCFMVEVPCPTSEVPCPASEFLCLMIMREEVAGSRVQV